MLDCWFLLDGVGLLVFEGSFRLWTLPLLRPTKRLLFPLCWTKI